MPASSRIEQIEKGLVSPNSGLSPRWRCSPFTWVLALVREPLLQSAMPLSDEHLGPLGRGELVRGPQRLP